MLDKDAVMSVSRAYALEVKKQFDPDDVLLFGSYAKGTANEDSDIDIAVIINDFEGNRLEFSARLFGLVWDFNTMIEPHLLNKYDNITGFLDEVIRTGIPLLDYEDRF